MCVCVGVFLQGIFVAMVVVPQPLRRGADDRATAHTHTVVFDFLGHCYHMLWSRIM